MRTLCRCTRPDTATAASRRGRVMAQFHTEHHSEILRSAGLTLGEWYVLSLIGTWPVPESEVAHTTANLSQGDPRGAISESQAFRAFNACLRKAYVTVVTDSYLKMLKFYLNRKPAIGPVCGLPKLGDVDFLPLGADLFLELRKKAFPSYTSHLHFVVEQPPQGFIFMREPDLKEFLEQNGRRKKPMKIGRVQHLGTWRRYWWDEFEDGLFVPIQG
jgi:hypothetical protein